MDDAETPILTIFHCEHKHSPTNCFGNDATKKQLWIQAVKDAGKHGVTVRQFLISPLEHRIFLILDSPDFQAIETAFGAVKGLGDMVITPVLEGTYLEAQGHLCNMNKMAVIVQAFSTV